MDIDPNYDPSDFLQMPSTSGIKPQTQPMDVANAEPSSVKQEMELSQQSETFDQSSFNMSEMLQYKPTEGKRESTPSDRDELEEPQENVVDQQSENPNHVAIHDDLAISDSDEDGRDGADADDEKKDNNSDNENDDDDFMRF